MGIETSKTGKHWRIVSDEPALFQPAPLSEEQAIIERYIFDGKVVYAGYVPAYKILVIGVVEK